MARLTHTRGSNAGAGLHKCIFFFATRAAAEPLAGPAARCAQNTRERVCGNRRRPSRPQGGGVNKQSGCRFLSWAMLGVANAMGRFWRLLEEIVCWEGFTV